MTGQLLVCRLGDTYIAFPLQFVHQVILAAALQPVPDAPDDLLGVLNYHGTLVPVITLQPFNNDTPTSVPELKLTDHFVLVKLPADQHAADLAGVLVSETIGVFNTLEFGGNIAWQESPNADLRWPASAIVGSRVVHLPAPNQVLSAEARAAFQAHTRD